MVQFQRISMAIMGMVAILLLFGGSLRSTDAQASEDTSAHKLIDEERLPQVIKSVSLDKDYSFAGELLPKSNFDAVERLDRELLVNSYWHSSTVLNIKNSRRYFPIIEPILAEEGVPDDFKYVAVIESNLRNVTSPAGAKGLWQFMKASAGAYGLVMNSEVDERYHVEKSTRAACKLIKRYHQRFGNWTDAAAAYNIGETRFARERERQKMSSYYDMNFGAETGRYVFRILAVKEILTRPQDFGFYLEDADYYAPMTNYQLVEVDKSIPNLGDFAQERGISYRMLKVYNPWLTASSLSVPPGRTYQVKLPSKG